MAYLSLAIGQIMRDETRYPDLDDPDSESWVGTPRQYRWLWWMLSAVIVLNVVDAIFTIGWVESGLAREANPLMAILMEQPILFICIKLALVSLGVVLLWLRRQRPAAVIGIVLIFVAYYAILLHHLRAVDVVMVWNWLTASSVS